MKLVSMKWVVPLLLLVAFYVGDQIRLGRPDHKYRLLIEIETPEGLKQTLGLLSVHPNRSYGGSGTGSSGPRTRGDAVVVALDAGKAVVALLASGAAAPNFDEPSFLAMRAIHAAGNNVAFREVKNFAGAAPVPVPTELTPVLLVFTDMKNPATARRVADGDLEPVLGKGYRLRGISLAVVANGFWPIDFGGALGEPITRGITETMPWLKTPDGADTALKAAGLAPSSGYTSEAAFTRP